MSRRAGWEYLPAGSLLRRMASSLAAPDPPQARPHPMRGPASPESVVRSGEQKEHRVAAPLEDTAAVVVRDRQKLCEAIVEDIVDLLGSHLAAACQSLAHRGEARDVDEGERPLGLGVRRGGAGSQPFDQERRDVRPQGPVCVLDRSCHAPPFHGRGHATRYGRPHGDVHRMANFLSYVQVPSLSFGPRKPNKSGRIGTCNRSWSRQIWPWGFSKGPLRWFTRSLHGSGSALKPYGCAGGWIAFVFERPCNRNTLRCSVLAIPFLEVTPGPRLPPRGKGAASRRRRPIRGG